MSSSSSNLWQNHPRNSVCLSKQPPLIIVVYKSTICPLPSSVPEIVQVTAFTRTRKVHQSSRRWSLPSTNQLSIRCLSTFIRWSNILCLSLVVVVHKTVRCSLFCLRLNVRFTKYYFSFKAMSQIFDKFYIKDILPYASSLHPSFSSCIKYSLCPASHA